MHKHADQPRSIELLRSRGQRPSGRRTTKKFDEVASPHCRPEAQDETSYRISTPICRGGAAPSMSALGQKQTFALHQPMSALPRKRTFAVQEAMSALGHKRALR